MTASAEISIMHMMVRRSMRFRSWDQSNNRPSRGSVENVIFDKTGHLAIGLPCPFMADSVAKVFLSHRSQIFRAVDAAMEY